MWYASYHPVYMNITGAYKMAPPTFPTYANGVEHRKPDLIGNFPYFENVKYFIAQIVVFE